MTFTRDEIVSLALEILIKSVILGIVLFYTFSILKPFITPVLWAIIIAVALSPLMSKLQTLLKMKRSKIIILFTALSVALLLIPTYSLSKSAINSTQNLVHELKDGSFTVPAPKESVKEWPLVGEKVYGFWEEASHDLKATLIQYNESVREYASKVASLLGSLIGDVIGFAASLVIAALFLIKEESSVRVYQAISYRLVGERGVAWAQLSALTIRSVVQGVIGIAIFQALLAFIGMVVVDVPFAWLWAFILLIVAIVQLPSLLVLAPIIVYVFSYADTTTATIFTVYAFLVGLSDNVLKPLLLGRGVDIPMLVILLGAIGGMLLSGVLGLFVGAVILSLAYKLFMTWVDESCFAALESSKN